MAQTRQRGKRGEGYLGRVSINGESYYQAAKSWTETNPETGEKKRRRITATAKTREEAYRRFIEKVNAAEGGEGVSAVKKPQKATKGQGTPYQEWFYQWLEQIPEDRISDIVRKGYRRKGEMYLLPFIGAKAVEELETEDLRNLFDFTLPSLKNSEGKALLSQASLLNIFRVLQMSLTEATRRRAINILLSPLDGVKPPKRNNTKKSLGKVIGQSLGLIAWMKETSHPDECRFLLQYLGLRRSERLGLSWADVKNLSSSKRAYIRVSQQVARYANGDGWYLKKPKTESSIRDIPLTEPFLSALRSWKKKQDEFKKLPTWAPEKQFEDLVFLTPQGGIIVPNRDNAEWHELLTAYLGEDEPHWNAHTNRHIFATLLAQEGVSQQIAMKALGHSSESMTYYYQAITKSSMVEPLEGYGKALTKRVKE